jgi:hypothetical protein
VVQVLQIIVAGRRRAALVGDLEDLAPGAFWTLEELRHSAEADPAAALLAA